MAKESASILSVIEKENEKGQAIYISLRLSEKSLAVTAEAIAS
jgi:hypothetical protein